MMANGAMRLHWLWPLVLGRYIASTSAHYSQSAETTARNAESLQWNDCSSTYGPGFSCANLTVPLDWKYPDEEQISLGMVRYRTNTSRASRLGHLLVNFGGPGGIGTKSLALSAPAFAAEIAENFDIVAVDPRGIGLSTPLKCDVDLWNTRVSLFPTTKDQFDRLVEQNEAISKSCQQLSGSLLFHMDTLSVARDLEAVRIALGDQQLNFLGFSYGSQIAYQYAELFPDNIRALVGDGITDHAYAGTTPFVTEGLTYENELMRFANWARSNNDSALRGQDVLDLIDELVNRAEISPIQAGFSPNYRSNVTGEEILFNIQGGLTSVDPGIGPGWAALTQALALGITGNASALATTKAVEGDIAGNSALFGGLAVGCQDWTHPDKGISDLIYKKQLAKHLMPHSRGHTQSYTYQARCLGWIAPVVNPPKLASVRDDVSMLLVGSSHDPETSYTWAESVREQVRGARLLMRDGDGHTSYFLGGATAAAMNAYLLNGTLPAENTVLFS